MEELSFIFLSLDKITGIRVLLLGTRLIRRDSIEIPKEVEVS